MEKIEKLRQFMMKAGVQAFITPSTDPHSGEYVPKHWESRSWLSGFTGSAGTAVVTINKAALWTDSRYFIQAAEQILDSGFVLMKDKIEGTPTVEEWLAGELKAGDYVGIDGLVNTVTAVDELKRQLEPFGIRVKDVGDPYEELWENRPTLPDSPVIIQGLEFSGERTASKLSRIREQIGSNGLLVSMLDEVCWTLNLRGNDIDYNPVFVSYLFITPKRAVLYVNRKKVDGVSSKSEGNEILVNDYLKAEGVDIKDYGDVFEDLKHTDVPVWVQPEKTNYTCFSLLKYPQRKECPISSMKVMKNTTEIEGYKRCMIKDGVAMVKWLKWLIPAVEDGGQTEMSLVRKLYELRAEQPLFMGDSFANIMGYGSFSLTSKINRNSSNTTKYWIDKTFLLLENIQDDILLEGTIWLDETFIKVRNPDVQHKEDGHEFRGISRNQMCIGIARDATNAVFFFEGYSKPSGKKVHELFSSHIKPGSKIVHDMERAHEMLIQKLGLKSEAYNSRNLKNLPDSENPLNPVNELCRLLQMFLHSHSGFIRDDIQGYLNLFSVLMNPPENKYQKVEKLLKCAIDNPILLRDKEKT